MPIAHRKADIGQDPAEVRAQLLPAARVGAIELEIHHRFAPALVVAQRRDFIEVAALVAFDTDDRMKQAMNGQVPGSDRIGDRIDEKGHIVIDDADAHPPFAGLAADRFDLEPELALAPFRSHLREEFSGFSLALASQALGLGGHFE